jgi:hypothetical protein
MDIRLSLGKELIVIQNRCAAGALQLCRAEAFGSHRSNIIVSVPAEGRSDNMAGDILPQTQQARVDGALEFARNHL